MEDGASPLKKLNFKRRLESNGFEIKQMNDGNRVYLEAITNEEIPF